MSAVGLAEKVSLLLRWWLRVKSVGSLDPFPFVFSKLHFVTKCEDPGCFVIFKET